MSALTIANQRLIRKLPSERIPQIPHAQYGAVCELAHRSGVYGRIYVWLVLISKHYTAQVQCVSALTISVVESCDTLAIRS